MADIRSAQVLAQVEWVGADIYDGAVSLTLTPSVTTVVGYSYSGAITLNLIPSAETSADYLYEGALSFSLTPTAATAMAFSYEGALSLTLLPGAEHEYLYEYLVEASGGVEVKGEGIIAFSTPSIYTVVGTGGSVIGGEGIEVFVLPPVYTIIAEGGLKALGEGEFTFIESEITEYALVGSGGLDFNGQGIFAFVNILPVFTLMGLGGYKLNGVGATAFEDPEVVEYILVGSGGYKLEGEGNFVYVTPDKIFTLVGTGELLLVGAGKIAWLDPDYFSVIGSGGVVISGEGTDEEFIYFTWVFSGVDYKPSIYSGYNFNSYCEFGGKIYGASEEGIFELSGKTDNGADIHTGFILGPHNLGVNNKKRLRSIHLGNKNIAARMRVTIDTTSKDFSVTNGKAKITRNLMGEEVTLEIADFKELSVIEVTPVVLGLRG